MNDIVIESNGLVIYCKSLRLNSQSKDIVMLYGDHESSSIGCLYVDEVSLKYRYENDIGKHYRVVSKSNPQK